MFFFTDLNHGANSEKQLSVDQTNLLQYTSGIYIISYGQKVKSKYSQWVVYGLLVEVAEH